MVFTCKNHLNNLMAMRASHGLLVRKSTATHCNTQQHTTTRTVIEGNAYESWSPGARITFAICLHHLLLHHCVCVNPTGWPRPIGCLKLQVIFHKRATNYRALLREMTYKEKASCGSSPLCMHCHM